MKYFRVISNKLPIGSMADYDSVRGEYVSRNGTLWEVEFWLYKFSISFAFTWWSEIDNGRTW